MRHQDSDTANVITFPPLIPLAGLLLSLALKRLRPLPIAPKWLSRPRRKAGKLLIVGGGVTAVWAAGTLLRAGTNVSPHQPSTALVESGPFEYTRNPIYIAGSAAYCGVTLLLNNLWGIVLLPTILAVLQRGIIEREEKYLRARFGDAYAEYMERVPRWL